MSLFFNTLVIANTLFEFKTCKSSVALWNKSFVILISLGDLLVGLYLIGISVMDTIIYEGDTYCASQAEWLTSWLCSGLGVMSAAGSQISLFSMTWLSVTRLFGVRMSNRFERPRSVNKKSVVQLLVSVILVLSASIVIAVFPLIPHFEDFFVNGVNYARAVPLFVGFPEKQLHLNVLQEYYGRIRGRHTLSWESINDMVDAMFTQEYGVDLGRKKVQFYGNSGVCLFKYFVTPDDPQKNFVWAILTINFMCFLLITVCYIVIDRIATKSSDKVNTKADKTRDNKAHKRNTTLQKKISIIITTDFLCWIPFIIVCSLHFFEILDATPTYALFSIVILPINSVINPLLYSDTLKMWRKKISLWRKSLYSPMVVFFGRNKIGINSVEMVALKRTPQPLPAGGPVIADTPM